MTESNQTIEYIYNFKFPDGIEKEFSILLDEKTLNIIPTPKDNYPEWTKTSKFQCPVCPFTEARHPHCSIAVNLVEVIDYFRKSKSYQSAEITIKTPNRQYFKSTALQTGLSSLIGIYMVSSGCPVMEKLKPMVKFHLPFATIDETSYRAISMYITAQFFRMQKGLEPDWELKDLVKIYQDIKIVNEHFYKRLSSIQIADANVNALIILNCFADVVPFTINHAMLNKVGNIFESYLKE